MSYVHDHVLFTGYQIDRDADIIEALDSFIRKNPAPFIADYPEYFDENGQPKEDAALGIEGEMIGKGFLIQSDFLLYQYIGVCQIIFREDENDKAVRLDLNSLAKIPRLLTEFVNEYFPDAVEDLFMISYSF